MRSSSRKFVGSPRPLFEAILEVVGWLLNLGTCALIEGHAEFSLSIHVSVLLIA